MTELRIKMPSKDSEKQNRIIHQTKLENGLLIVTVFLGLDQSNGEPLIFQTMVLTPKKEATEYLVQVRYSNEALKGHWRIVKDCEELHFRRR